MKDHSKLLIKQYKYWKVNTAVKTKRPGVGPPSSGFAVCSALLAFFLLISTPYFFF